MNRHLLSFAFFLALATPLSTWAQTKPARPAGAIEANNSDQFLMRDGEVVMRQGTTTKPLTKNVVLADGTKINYKSGIVELPGGKKTTLREGDYVTMKGEIVFATPGSAASSRGTAASVTNPSQPTGGQYEQYVDRNSVPTTADMETRLTSLNSRITLMAQKIQLLNDKISLLSGSTQRPADTSQLDQQIKALDEQLRQVK